VAETYSLREVFRQYLDTEKPTGPICAIGKLIASGAFSRASFDELAQTKDISGAWNFQETLLDVALIFTQKCVDDHELSEAEIAELETLITIFQIEEGKFFKFRRDALQKVTCAQTTWVLKDRYVTEQEDILQGKFQRLFGLSYDQYVGLLRPLAKEYIEELEGSRLAIQDREELELIDSCIRNLRGVFLVAQ
jgi:hypothetical protein